MAVIVQFYASAPLFPGLESPVTIDKRLYSCTDNFGGVMKNDWIHYAWNRIEFPRFVTAYPSHYTEWVMPATNTGFVCAVIKIKGLKFIHICTNIFGNQLKNKIQLDATHYFIMLMLGSTYFGHHYAHHQELTTIALVTTYAVWFSSCCWLEFKCRQDG